jgi:ComF family protein
MILAVPLGEKRLKQRGYNQAELIANGLAEEMQIPISKNILRRTRETRSQVGLDSISRFRNVHEPFHADPKAINKQIVFLVDDLLTTGATLVACTRALMTAGVQKVYGLTVARA